MNVWDVVILAAVAIGLALAARLTWKKRKRGGCSCGCDGCMKSAGCNRRISSD